jgi:hypothetical protein
MASSGTAAGSEPLRDRLDGGMRSGQAGGGGFRVAWDSSVILLHPIFAGSIDGT